MLYTLIATACYKRAQKAKLKRNLHFTCQRVSNENIHADNIIQILEVIFRSIHVNTHESMYAVMNTEKRVHEFERVGSGLDDGKEWDKYCN